MVIKESSIDLLSGTIDEWHGARGSRPLADIMVETMLAAKGIFLLINFPAGFIYILAEWAAETSLFEQV